MPQNAFQKRWEKNEKVIEKSKERINRLVKIVGSKENGKLLSNPISTFIFFTPMYYIFKPVFKNIIAKKTDVSSDLSLGEIMYIADKGYKTNEKCSGCGICANACP